MKQVLVLASVLTLTLGAPQFLVEEKEISGDECHVEYVTVWEEVETEEVNKVICETEFNEECFTEHDIVCVNSTEPVCDMIDELICVDNITNKCGLELVLKNETYTETECSTIYRNICEYEWIGEGKTRKWVPVEDSCVTKPFEECEDVIKYREHFVEEEVCRDIPIKDCRNNPKEVCVDPEMNEICEDVPVEQCEIVPHEECKQVIEKVPNKISKKVATVICNDTDDETENEDEIDIQTSIDVADVSENEIPDNHEKDDATETIPDQSMTPDLVHEQDLSNTSITDANNEARQDVDNSRIIFSDEEIDSRNKLLATRIFIDEGLISTKTNGHSNTVTPTKGNSNNDRIFFPDQDILG